MKGTSFRSPITEPGAVGAMPPVVFTRWMKVTELKIPAPSVETFWSINQVMAVESGVHPLPGMCAATTLLPLLLSHVGPTCA